ncbi:ABC transporter ATP-binding protein [Georgenia sp. Z1344]|uniref:ABC transporter ATP-binding protein n=1 Tax=Georgenia sp. Z1344 TaxID=3416706 RepID=UPI003CED1B59
MRLEATDLVVGYAFPVCPPVTFSVGPGEALAVVGVNGTGKSTVLRTVLGMLPALGGEARIDGRAPDPRSARQRAAISHDLGDEVFFPGLSAAEHLELTALGHGGDSPGELAGELLTEFGLAERSRAVPSALSSGQRRRLLLAAAFARPRELLVLDEPESRLDTGARHRVADRLADEREAGRAVLFASHDPATVQLAATSVLVLSDDGVRITDAEDGADLVAGL